MRCSAMVWYGMVWYGMLELVHLEACRLLAAGRLYTMLDLSHRGGQDL